MVFSELVKRGVFRNKFSDYCCFKIEGWNQLSPIAIIVLMNAMVTLGHQQRATNYSWGGRGPGYEQLPYPAQPQYNMPMPMPPSYRWDHNTLLPIYIYVLAFAVNASNKVIHLWTNKQIRSSRPRKEKFYDPSQPKSLSTFFFRYWTPLRKEWLDWVVKCKLLHVHMFTCLHVYMFTCLHVYMFTWIKYFVRRQFSLSWWESGYLEPKCKWLKIYKLM